MLGIVYICDEISGGICNEVFVLSRGVSGFPDATEGFSFSSSIFFRRCTKEVVKSWCNLGTGARNRWRLHSFDDMPNLHGLSNLKEREGFATSIEDVGFRIKSQK